MAKVIRRISHGTKTPGGLRLGGEKMMGKIDEAQAAGAAWMGTVLVECEDPEEWLRLTSQEFIQAVSNTNCPPFPTFETAEETDAAYQGAWGQLEVGRKLHAEDNIYQEDLAKRWEDYNGK